MVPNFHPVHRLHSYHKQRLFLVINFIFSHILSRYHMVLYYHIATSFSLHYGGGKREEGTIKGMEYFFLIMRTVASDTLFFQNRHNKDVTSI